MSPKATHDVEELQATRPNRKPFRPKSVFGKVGNETLTHCDPFQRSINGLQTPFEMMYPPVATQNEGDVQVPPAKSEDVPNGLGAFGAETLCHLLPFQCSTNTPFQNPAIMQKLLDTHEICWGDAVGCAPPNAMPGSVWGAYVRGLKIGTTVHREPFHAMDVRNVASL